MKELLKIAKAIKEAGYEECINFDKNGLYVNCSDTQYITENEDGTITMNTVGGSRYCYPHIRTADKCIEVMLKQLKKTSEDIDNEYKKIYNEI